MTDVRGISCKLSGASSDAVIPAHLHAASPGRSGILSSDISSNEGKDSAHPISADQCPLCGRDNGCAITRQLPPESCWCMKVNIPMNVRTRIPEKQRNQACICQRCAGMKMRDK
ncbi:cysteine-rich CWC family protein [Paenibacillus wulumuqiensis]|uniref:cysteine-rich CWC family protein n=1 Tax=Paenibacillus wulumuqiensis TaxID=1567107 RepID=UPI0009E3D8C0